MSAIKRLFEDIEVLVEDGMNDQDISTIICLKYGPALREGDWLLRQITEVRDGMGVYD